MKTTSILTATLFSALSLSVASASLTNGGEGEQAVLARSAGTAPINLDGLGELERGLGFSVIQTPGAARLETAQRYGKNAMALMGAAYTLFRVAKFMGWVSGPELSVVETVAPSIHEVTPPKTQIEYKGDRPPTTGTHGSVHTGRGEFYTLPGESEIVPGSYDVKTEEPSLWWRLFVGE